MKFAFWLRKLKLGLYDNPGGVGGGREAQEAGDICTYDWSMLKYSRNQYNIVIILQLTINKGGGTIYPQTHTVVACQPSHFSH